MWLQVTPWLLATGSLDAAGSAHLRPLTWLPLLLLPRFSPSLGLAGKRAGVGHEGHDAAFRGRARPHLLLVKLPPRVTHSHTLVLPKKSQLSCES